MGAEAHGTENNIRRRYTTITLNGVPVWKGVLDITCYKAKLIYRTKANYEAYSKSKGR